MKLRYYMRGLGIGVVVTAILMGISLGGDKEKLTDAEIMARAKELGMVESSVLANLGKDKEQEVVQNPPSNIEDTVKEEESKTGESQEEESRAEESQEEESRAEESQEEESRAEESQEEESRAEESQEEETKVEESKEEYITLVIERGESSVSVSKSLEELGLVESAKDYDKFLCANGYDKYIRVGTHKIKMGSTDEEIAEIISRKKN